MTESSAFVAGTKRKRPPTFPHLPADRAKKLKKAWVEKTKIKSKWKAEKRKEDLASSSKLDIPVYDEDEGDRIEKDEPDAAADASPPAAGRAETSPRPHIHPSRAHIHPNLPVKQEVKPTKKQKVLKEDAESEPIKTDSVRELMKEAYSPSTLHTFKADPLKKRASSERGGGRGRVREQGERGRGQPNMKLRMNAMLAKIKQDYA